MKILNSTETKKRLPLIYDLAHQMIGPEFVYRETPEVIARLQHPFSTFSSALSDDGTKMIAFVSMSITTEGYYQKLLSGRVREDEFEIWDNKDTPLLFLRNLVLIDRRATPYLFHSALKDLHSVCSLYNIYIHRAFTITNRWVTRAMLQKFQFLQEGTFASTRPIMTASRDTSIVLNSFLKQYESVG